MSWLSTTIELNINSLRIKDKFRPKVDVPHESSIIKQRLHDLWSFQLWWDSIQGAIDSHRSKGEVPMAVKCVRNIFYGRINPEASTVHC